MAKFKKLDVPYQWKDEFTKYPHGYTIFEALCKWTEQVDNMVDLLNETSDYMDEFIRTFDEGLRDEVSKTIEAWKKAGLLDDILTAGINKTINTLRNDLEGAIDLISDDIATLSDRVTSLNSTNTSEHTAINRRIDNIITTPADSVSAQEIIDARRGSASLRDALEELLSSTLHRSTSLKSYDDIDDFETMGIYRCTRDTIPKNWPSETGGMLIVLKPHATLLSGTAQIVVDFNSEVYVRSAISSGWKSFQQSIRGLHIDMTNYVKHADSYKKLSRSWVTREKMPYMVKAGTYGEYPKGTTVNGLPYSSVFYAGNDILYNKNINSFYSAVENPASVLYTQVGGDGRSNRAGIWGIVCSTLVGWLCGQDIYRTTNELEEILDFYEYNDIADVHVGDVMLRSGHVKMVYDIEYNATGDVEVIRILESRMPVFIRQTLSQTDFEKELEKYGGEYKLGRFPDYKPRTLPKIDYATDCIPEFGDNSVYKDGSTIWLYISNDSSQIHYRKKGSQFTTVTLDTLTNKVVNGVTVYDITHLLNSTGMWEVTTNVTNSKYCNILVVNTGDVTVDNFTVSVDGYSNEIKPLWYQIIKIFNTPPTNEFYFHAPDGWKAQQWLNHKYYIDTPTFPEPTECDGFYVRVYYDTPFGQIYNDSDYIIY